MSGFLDHLFWNFLQLSFNPTTPHTTPAASASWIFLLNQPSHLLLCRIRFCIMVFYVLEKNEAESNSVAVVVSVALKGDPNYLLPKEKQKRSQRFLIIRTWRLGCWKPFVYFPIFSFAFFQGVLYTSWVGVVVENGWKITPLCLLLLCNWPVK